MPTVNLYLDGNLHHMHTSILVQHHGLRRATGWFTELLGCIDQKLWTPAFACRPCFLYNLIGALSFPISCFGSKPCSATQYATQ